MVLIINIPWKHACLVLTKLSSEVKKLVKKIKSATSLVFLFASRGRTDGLIYCQQFVFIDLYLTRRSQLLYWTAGLSPLICVKALSYSKVYTLVLCCKS